MDSFYNGQARASSVVAEAAVLFVHRGRRRRNSLPDARCFKTHTRR